MCCCVPNFIKIGRFFGADMAILKTADVRHVEFLVFNMGSSKSPCRTSYWSSIETIALDCLVVGEYCVLCTYFWRQTDKRKKGQTNRPIA